MINPKNTYGELVLQAERKYSNFDPKPDLDNANVGMTQTKQRSSLAELFFAVST